MKIYLKKKEYEKLFKKYFNIMWLLEYIEFNEFAKKILVDKWLVDTYTKQSIYRFLKWAHAKYLNTKIIDF